jgi:thiamine monophosphate kinase
MIGADIFLNKIPLSEPLKKIFNLFGNKMRFWNFVLGGGEDYELIFSVPPKKKKCFNKKRILDPKLTKIGRFTKEKRMKIYDLNFKSLKFKKIGYSHF